MNIRKLTLIIVVLALVGASVGGYYKYRNNAEAPQVTTASVTRGDVIDTVGATGALEAVTTVQVGTQVSGTVQALYADFNSIVRRGQVIARLDPSLFQTQIEQARANLLRAQADVDRLRVALEDAKSKLSRAQGLSAKGLIPQSELETAQVNVHSTEAQIRSAQAQVTQARASLNQNEVNLAHTVIKAPIDGIVISRNVDVGQTVAASMQAPTLFILAADLTKMQVNASVDEADVGRIRPDQTVRFRVDAYPTEEFFGRVAQVRLQPVTVQNVVTYATVIEAQNRELKLKPGMTANVTIEIARRSNVLRAPNAALRFRPTTDIFAALNQPVPPEMQRGAGGVGRGAPGSGGRVGVSGPAGTAGSSSVPVAGSPAAGSPALQGRGPARGAEAPRRDGTSGAQGRPPMDDARRQRFMERMNSMPPAEREQFLARMKERGFDPSRGQREEGARPAGARAPRERAASRSQPAAQTIDSLFGPLPSVETAGRVWLFGAGQLKPIRVRLGVSDGTFTELLTDDLKEETQVVTNVSTGREGMGAPSRTGGSSPLIPQRGGPPGQRSGGGSSGGGGPRR